MNDPHVKAVTYRITCPDPQRIVALEAEPFTTLVADFAVEIDNFEATFRPNAHFPDMASARAALEPIIRDWEAAADLFAMTPVEFHYVSTAIEDRSPEKASSEVSTFRDVRGSVGAYDTGISPKYPAPPPNWFHESDLLKQLRLRWRAVREHRAPILAEAYFCLTALEHEHGSRSAVAQSLNVDRAVLQKVAELASIYDPQRGRKARGPIRHLTMNEESWLFDAVLRLIARQAQAEGKVTPARLTMRDLPTI